MPAPVRGIRRSPGRRALKAVGLARPLFRGRVNRAISADREAYKDYRRIDQRRDALIESSGGVAKMTPEQKTHFDYLSNEAHRRYGVKEKMWDRRQAAIEERSGKRITFGAFDPSRAMGPTVGNIRGPIRYALAGKEARERLKRMRKL